MYINMIAETNLLLDIAIECLSLKMEEVLRKSEIMNQTALLHGEKERYTLRKK